MDRMVVTKGKQNTRDIVSCKYNEETHMWDVIYKEGKKYNYAYNNIELLTDFKAVDARDALFFYDNRLVSLGSKIYEFIGRTGKKHYRFVYDKGNYEEYEWDQLTIEKSCIDSPKSRSVLEYLK